MLSEAPEGQPSRADGPEAWKTHCQKGSHSGGVRLKAAERQTFLLHADTEGYAERIAVAREVISEALRRAKKPYVAVSGGKDSMVMLHLILSICPSIQVRHWDYGPYYMPRELEAEILRNIRKIGAEDLKVDTSEKYAHAGRTPKNIFFPTFFGGIQPRLVKGGTDVAFIGLRAQESIKRKWKTIEPSRWNGMMWECYPIRDLLTKDVWGYIVQHDLPYCSHYDRYGALLGIEGVRMSTFFDPEFDHIGQRNVDGILMPKFKAGGDER